MFRVNSMLPLDVIAKKTIFISFDLWPLTSEPWPLVLGVCETQVPILGHLPTKFEENRSSRLGGVFDTIMHKEYTFDLLSRDLWPQLPWQPHILIILDISVIPERFHVNSMFSYGVIAKKRFSLNLTSDLWPLTFGSESLRDIRAYPRAPSHQVWRKSAQPFRRSFWHKKGQTHKHTHTHTHPHTHTHTHGHLLTPPSEMNIRSPLGTPPWVTPRESLLRNTNRYHGNRCYGNWEGRE